MVLNNVLMGNRKKKSGMILWVLGIVLTVWLASLSYDFYQLKAKPYFFGSSLASDDQITTDATEKTQQNVLVLDDNIGDAATITWLVYDREADTETSVTADLAIYKTDFNKAGEVTGVTKVKDIDSYASGTSLTTLKVGDVFSVYGGNSSAGVGYYCDPKLNVKIDGVTQPTELDCHKQQQDASMQVTCYDDTGANALSGGTDTSQEDYDITLGNNEEAGFFCELKNNAANGLFQLKAVAVAVENDIDFCNLVNADDWTQGGVLGKNLSKTQINGTTVDYDYVWEYKKGTNEVISLKEFQKKKLEFRIKGDGNPATNSVYASSDMCIVQFLDANWAEDKNGRMVFDWYQHDDNGNNVGAIEAVDSPAGKTTGAVIEGI